MTPPQTSRPRDRLVPLIDVALLLACLGIFLSVIVVGVLT